MPQKMRTKEVLTDGYEANADLSSNQYKAHTLSSDKAALVSSAGAVGAGVLLNDPTSGQEATLGLSGIYPIVLGGTVSPLDPLTTDANGDFVKAQLGDAIWAYALHSGVDDDTIAAFFPGTQNMPRNLDEDGAGYGMFRATYDVSGGDSGAIGTHDLGVNLPSGAIVTWGGYEVITTFTDGASDTATIALGIASDDATGLKAAVAISDAGNPWDDGFHDLIQDGTAANYSTKTTAERALQATVATAALTAGKLVVFGHYFVSDAG